MIIGISISDPGEEELAKQGMAMVHLQDMMVETARYLLSKGHTIAYGGDLTFEGSFNFTDLLFQLSRAYGATNKIKNYSAFPLYTKITSQREAELFHVAEIVRIDPDTLLSPKWKGVRYENATYEERTYLDELFEWKSDHAKQIWSSSLTAMRKQMTKDIDCRIVVGGKLTGYKGSMPGIAEETILCLKANIPVYIDGRFGGAAREVLQIIRQIQSWEVNNLKEQFSDFSNQSWQEINQDVICINSGPKILEIDDLFKIL
jgi:hypothetical protein